MAFANLVNAGFAHLPRDFFFFGKILSSPCSNQLLQEGAVEFEWGNKYARPSRYCDHSYVRIPRRLLSPRADLYRGITAAGHASADDSCVDAMTLDAA